MIPEPVRPKGPRLRTAILVIVLGLILGVGGAAKIGTVFWDLFTGPTYILPGTVRTQLDSGTNIVFERTSTGRFSSSNGVTIDPSQVTVIAPGGAEVPVRASNRNEFIDRNSDHFVPAVEFNAPTSGRYVIRFDTGRVRVLIQPSLGDIAKDNIVWFLAAGLGGLMFLAGIVLLIVGIVRRSSARRAGTVAYAPVGTGPASYPPVGTAPVSYPPVETTPVQSTPIATEPVGPATVEAAPAIPPPTVAPAGWFPDPHGEHRLRYWDGTTWTEHISD